MYINLVSREVLRGRYGTELVSTTCTKSPSTPKRLNKNWMVLAQPSRSHVGADVLFNQHHRFEKVSNTSTEKKEPIGKRSSVENTKFGRAPCQLLSCTKSFHPTMTAAVAPLPISLQLADSTSEARKRRREILSSQRNNSLDSLAFKSATAVEVPEGQVKRHKPNETVIAKISQSKNGKKPQMKYDPDVPMTKEEAAAWRREQRRKRNRESAAASRQRQRDRIAELEVEVEDWKTHFEAILKKIKKLEEATGKNSEDFALPEQTQIPGGSNSKFVSPPSSPGHSPMSSPVASPVSSSLVIHTVQVTPEEGFENQVSDGEEHEHSDKMISRQATSRIIHYHRVFREYVLGRLKFFKPLPGSPVILNPIQQHLIILDLVCPN